MAFSEGGRAFLFGREQTVEELVRLVCRNPLTMLFGRSEIGEFSPLQAGALPLLREADFRPHSRRDDHFVRAEAPSPRSPATAPGASRLELSFTDQVKSALVEAQPNVS